MCDKKFYDISSRNYYKTAVVQRVPRCMGFMFTNIGDVIANVNGMVIYPNTVANSLGDSRTIMGHAGEEYKGPINLQFDINTAGTNPNVEIVQMFYVESK